MSLMDESFPYDEIFDSKSKVFDDSNDHSLPMENNETKVVKKKTPKIRDLQFQSVNDLHSKYSLKKYKHVPSKVRQYIVEMKEEDKKRRKTSKLPRFNSFPTSSKEQYEQEAQQEEEEEEENNSPINKFLTDNNHNKKNNFLSISGDGSDLTSLENIYQNHKFNILIESDSNNNKTDKTNYNSNNDSNSNNNSDNSITSTELMNKFCSEIKELRSMNEYLQTNLDNKVAQVAKLKRSNDAMQIDMVHLQDKLKNVHHRNSLPESYILWSQGKCTQATQTDDEKTLLNILEDYHLNETFLFNLTTSDSFILNGKPLRTPELNKIKKSAKIDQDCLSINSGVSEKQQNCDRTQLQHDGSSNLRLRSNSNDGKKRKSSDRKIQTSQQSQHVISNNGSDSAIESETEIDEENHQIRITSDNLEPFVVNSNKSKKKNKSYKNCDNNNNNNNNNNDNNNKNKSNKNNFSRKPKKNRFLKKSIWKRFLGSCGNCRKEKYHQDESILYTQVNLSESVMYEADTTN